MNTDDEEYKIANDGQLVQTIDQMGRMYRILHGLSQEELPRNRQFFAVMAEGPLEYIGRLHKQLDAYITEITKPLAEEAEAWEAQQSEAAGQEEKEREEIAA
jgi:hypothetical protein